MVFLPCGKTLLFHGKDGHDPSHTWWFTAGGGIEPGETAREAAARELEEETGIQLNPATLLGPAALRYATFEFTNITARQEETYYLLYLTSDARNIDRSGQSSTERSLVDGWEWFSADSLETLSKLETVYPTALPELVRRWEHGWDGTCLRLST